MSTDLKLQFMARVQDGNLTDFKRKEFQEYLKNFEGKRVTITVQRARSTRSIQQNRLWWVYMTILADHTGHTKDEMHEICKFKFLKRELVSEKTGEVFEYLSSTSTLSKSEFSDLVEQVIAWAAQSFGVTLPRPGEQVGMDV